MNKKAMQALLFGGMGVILAGVLVYAFAFGNTVRIPANDGTADGTDETSQSSEAAAVSNPIGLPDSANKVRIDLSQSTGNMVVGSGASLSGDKVTITQAGEYLITGSMNGQIYVEAGKEDTVVLRLAGAEIVNVSDAAIHIENAGTTWLWLDEGTENLLQSGAAPAEGVLSAQADEEASGGAVYARDDLTIAGEGSLRVLGYLNNGVQTSNNLTISGGNITVEAVNHGMKGKDSVAVTGGSLDIQAVGDGIKSDDATGEGYGTVTISGGEISIRADQDGVQAETTLEVTGGSFDIVTGGGSANASDRGGDRGGFGGWFGMDVNDTWDREDDGQPSAKGFKSGVATTITGGTITADCLDDAIHSNGDITISGGVMTLATGDDGVHADNALLIQDGTITVTQSYEGLEANLITIDGGTLDITARDDGINAYGGQNRMGGGRGGFGGGGKTTDTMPELTINGGTITVNAGGDGLDSNGNLTVNGGVTIVNGPTNSGNGALDVGSENGGVATVTGGTVLALGASGMDETFDGGSTQCSLRYRWSSAFSAGDEILITDAAGKELFRYTAVKSGSSVVFTAPELTQGGAYTVKAGSLTGSITLDSVSASAGTGGGGFGGGFGGGGRQNGGQRPDRGDFGGFNGQQPPDGMPEPPDGAQPPDGMQGRGNRQGMMGEPPGAPPGAAS